MDKTDDWLELERLANIQAAWAMLLGRKEIAQQYADHARRCGAKASRATLDTQPENGNDQPGF